MNADRFTTKMHDALSRAQAIAYDHGQSEIMPAHMVLSLLEQDNGLLPQLLARSQIEQDTLKNRLREEIERLPKMGRSDDEMPKIYISQALDLVFIKAQEEAKRLKDEYISVEHFLLALFQSKSAERESRLLKDSGLTRDMLLKMLADIRGSQRVSSADPETTYQVLEKYGRELVQEAKSGQLDPVIGRDTEIRRVIRILSRKTKNNPVLIGEPGVGKTTIVEGLAQRIVRGMSLRGSKIRNYSVLI